MGILSNYEIKAINTHKKYCCGVIHPRGRGNLRKMDDDKQRITNKNKDSMTKETPELLKGTEERITKGSKEVGAIYILIN